MNGYLIQTLALNELRLRTRRLSTMFVLLAIIALAWLMIPDTSRGYTLMSVQDSRVLYTSSAIAIGSATFGGMLFGLAGFYLVRGRMGEDIRSGAAAVIGATPVGNAMFLFGRWLGAVLTLASLAFAFMLTMMALQLLRGEGAINPLIYLQCYVLVLLPTILFSASCAILFDSVGPLMGKAGDVLYFFMWIAQLSLMAAADQIDMATPVLLAIDFSGMVSTMKAVTLHLGTKHISLGGGDFDPALPTTVLPALLWTVPMTLARGASAVLATLPLLPAVLLFHRFSPDKVRVSRSRKRRSPLEVANQWLRPLARLVQPLFRLAAALPGTTGQVVADVALTLATSPSAVAALLAVMALSLFAPAAALPGVLCGAAAAWGVLVCSISTRDYDGAVEDMTGAVAGGVSRRFLRQYGAAVLLGFLFTGIVALRWAASMPLQAAAVAAGVLSMAALAGMLGRCTRSARTFLALFLFWVYLSVNVRVAPMIDVFGFNGVANAQSMLAWLCAGGLALAAGYAWNRRT